MRKNYRKKKFNKKRKSTYKIFFLILVGMTLGFAAINTTLQLIGTLNISRTTWDIHFENPTKTGGVSATKEVALKENDNTTVEYQVKLTNPGDYYEFTVDAKNSGTIDGMITGISNKVYENNTEVTLPAYLESTITYSDGKTIEPNHLLASTKKETYKVKVEYKQGLYADQLPDQEKTYNFRFTVTYMQADENAKNRLITLPTGKTKDNLEVGDEICINGATIECFNFIKYDGTNNEDIVMLAKYNLNVGSRAKGTATNLQDGDVKGFYPNATTYGTITFSKTNYWYDGSSIKPEYGSSFPADVYDPINYKGTPGESDYSIAYYVEEYKAKLSNYGIPIKDARLLLNSEYSTSYPFIYNTSFWLSSAGTGFTVAGSISGEGTFNNYYSDSSSYYQNIFGVRPVIVITKSSF